MKSPDPVDPCRLHVTDVDVQKDHADEEHLIITVTLKYEPWWVPVDHGDILYEKINAMTCIRDVLSRGGIKHD